MAFLWLSTAFCSSVISRSYLRPREQARRAGTWVVGGGWWVWGGWRSVLALLLLLGLLLLIELRLELLDLALQR